MTEEQFDDLIAAITRIAHGDNRYSMGLEALAMALSGEGPKWYSVSEGLKDVAEAINDFTSFIALEGLTVNVNITTEAQNDQPSGAE